MSYIKYLLLLIPVGFFWLVLLNKQKYKKLKSSGRVPELEAADRNANLFTAAAVISLLAILYLLFM